MKLYRTQPTAMKFAIRLKHSEGILKVSEFECLQVEASMAFAKYLARHYPVRFTKNCAEGQGAEKPELTDCRTGIAVWRYGRLWARMEQGLFFAEPDKSGINDVPWWKKELSATKSESIETAIESAWKKGYAQGREMEANNDRIYKLTK